LFRFFTRVPNAAHHPTPGQQDTLQLQVPSLAQSL
jgi:hypothetical protein